MLENPIFLRLLGAVVTGFGVTYWYNYRDPFRNVAIMKSGVVDNELVALTITIFTVVRKSEDTGYPFSK